MIERSEAVDLVRKMQTYKLSASDDLLLVNQAVVMTELMLLPPAQPERKTGKWIPDNLVGGGYWVCTVCKHPTEAFAADVLYKFCPFCGSEMRGEADEQP